MNAAFERELRKYILDYMLFGDETVEVDAEASFLELGLIDSTGALELIRFIEDATGIRMRDEELVPENLDSIGAIVRYVSRKRGGS